MSAGQLSASKRWVSGLLAGFLLVGSSPGARAQATQPVPAAASAALTEATLLPLPATVPLTGPLTLAFRLRGTPLAGHSDFPEIAGFRKDGLRTTTTTQLLPGGARRTELTVTQRYLPYGEGEFVVPPFTLTVNGQLLRSAGGRVRVVAPAPNLAAQPTPPGTGLGSLDQLLGRPKPEKFYEPPDAAFLALEADRASVYTGQGVQVSLNFYLRPADQALLSFYDFSNQLTELLRQLRQPSAWEVPAEPAAAPDTVRRAGGVVLLRFRLARRTYYPLTARALDFPTLRLTLTKFRLLKNPQPGDTERLARYKTYVAPPLRVAVQPLPGPAAAVVGDYALRELPGPVAPRTGTAFAYALAVEGVGNAAALTPPPLRPRAGLEVFGPDVREERLPGGQLRKTFRYRLLAQRPGLLPLDSLWQLPVFNPRTAHYDTLRPRQRVVVSGAGPPPPPAALPPDDPFYGPALTQADAQLQALDIYQQVSRYAAGLLAALFVVAAVGAWRAGR